MTTPPPDSEIDSFLQSGLEPGEIVGWTGRPLPAAFAAREAPSVLLGLAGVGMAAFYVASTLGFGAWTWARINAASLPVLISMLVAAGGIYLMMKPLLAARQACRSAYAVTDRRAIIVTSGSFRQLDIQSFPASRLGVAELLPQPDGTGDVVLGTILVRVARRRRFPAPVFQPRKIGFFAVADPDAAYAAVLQLAKNVPREPPTAVPPVPRSARLGLPLLLLIPAAIMLGLGGTGLAAARRSAGWPTVSGTVLRASVETVRGRHVSYRARIDYLYRVGHQSFQGNRVAYGDSSDRARRDEILHRYLRGSAVSVSYDPAHPSDSVLEPGIHPSAWLMPGFAAVFILASAGFAWSYGSSFRTRPTVGARTFGLG